MNIKKINYLRISVTNRCNMRCKYCMPDGNTKQDSYKETLSLRDISKLVDAATSFGVDTVRVTGGEPLLRDDIAQIISRVRANSSVKRVHMTTNGATLAVNLDSLKSAGLNSVNISLDTLKRDRFLKITGENTLSSTFTGIKKAKEYFSVVKLNVVIMRNVNDDEIIDFCRFADDSGVIVRFIEFMPYSDCNADLLLSAEEIIKIIEDNFGSTKQVSTVYGMGPAIYYQAERLKNPLGIIASATSPSCTACNRLRITADGRLLSCLYGTRYFDLKEALESGSDIPSIFEEAIISKLTHPRSTRCELIRPMIEVGG